MAGVGVVIALGGVRVAAAGVATALDAALGVGGTLAPPWSVDEDCGPISSRAHDGSPAAPTNSDLKITSLWIVRRRMNSAAQIRHG